MSTGKKKKTTKKVTAVLEQNIQSLRRLLKLYNQYCTEYDSVACPEVTKTIRSLIEDGETLTSVKFFV
jgi:hypothetical protein